MPVVSAFRSMPAGVARPGSKVSNVNLRTRGIVCTPNIPCPHSTHVAEKPHVGEASKETSKVSAKVVNVTPSEELLTHHELEVCRAVLAEHTPVALASVANIIKVIEPLNLPTVPNAVMKEMVQTFVQREQADAPGVTELTYPMFIRLITQIKEDYVLCKHSSGDVEIFHVFQNFQSLCGGAVTNEFLHDNLKQYNMNIPMSQLGEPGELQFDKFSNLISLDSAQAEDVFVDFGGTPGINGEDPGGVILLSHVETLKHPFCNSLGYKEVVRFAQILCGEGIDFQEFREMIYLPTKAIARNPGSIAAIRNQLAVAKKLQTFVDEGMNVAYNRDVASRGMEESSFASAPFDNFIESEDLGGEEKDQNTFMSLLNWWYWKEQKKDHTSVTEDHIVPKPEVAIPGTDTLKRALQVVGQRARKTAPEGSEDKEMTEDQAREKVALKRIGLAMMVLNVTNQRKSVCESNVTPDDVINSSYLGDSVNMSRDRDIENKEKSLTSRASMRSTRDSIVPDHSADAVLTAGITRIANGTFRMQSKRDLLRESVVLGGRGHSIPTSRRMRSTVTFEEAITSRGTDAPDSVDRDESMVMTESMHYSMNSSSTSSHTTRDSSNSQLLEKSKEKEDEVTTPSLKNMGSRSLVFSVTDSTSNRNETMVIRTATVGFESEASKSKKTDDYDAISNIQTVESQVVRPGVPWKSPPQSSIRREQSFPKNDRRFAQKKSVVLPPESGNSAAPKLISRSAQVVKQKGFFSLFRLAKPRPPSPFYHENTKNKQTELLRKKREAYRRLKDTSQTPRRASTSKHTPYPPGSRGSSGSGGGIRFLVDADGTFGGGLGKLARGGGGVGEIVRIHEALARKAAAQSISEDDDSSSPYDQTQDIMF